MVELLSVMSYMAGSPHTRREPCCRLWCPLKRLGAATATPIELGKPFADHAEPVAEPLPFTARWAQKLLQLAGNEALLGDGAFAFSLPSAESVLGVARKK